MDDEICRCGFCHECAADLRCGDEHREGCSHAG